MTRCIFFLALLVLALACQTQEGPSDHVIARGSELFTIHCSACHTMQRDGIGPKLAGIYQKTGHAWLTSFIKDPPAVARRGDLRARMIAARYPSPMPGFAHLGDLTLDTIVSYLSTENESADLFGLADIDTSLFMDNPIADTIPLSPLVLEIEQIATVPATAEKGPLARINMLRDNAAEPGRLYVNDLRGFLYYLEDGQVQMFLDIRAQKPNFVDAPGLGSGFGSFAFHPDFAHNRLFYTTHTEKPGTGPSTFAYPDSLPVIVEWVLTEWKVDALGQSAFKGTDRELLRMYMPFGQHGVQDIAFNAHAVDPYERGLLYIGIGDGGSNYSGIYDLCCHAGSIHSAILRIDPLGDNSQNGMYGIPPDNPMASSADPSVIRERWAWGFRNPHRFCWDPADPEVMLVTEIGERQIEEVNLVQKGRDYGWNQREGTYRIDFPFNNQKVLPLPEDEGDEYTYPVAQYDHSEGNAIGTGIIYRQDKFPLLQGKYLFGDIVSDDLFYIEMEDVKQGSQAPIQAFQLSHEGQVTHFRQLLGKGRIDLHLGWDQKGNIYFLTKANGAIWRLKNVRSAPES